MRRREVITLIGGTAVAWPLAARAQRADRMYRVGFIAGGLIAGGDNPRGAGAGPVISRGVPALLDEFRRLGFIAGQNLTMDYRSANQPTPQFAVDIAEMVRAKPDLIVISGVEAQLQAVMPVSGLIPIVFFANNFDPIERGYVKSLARPGGNLTGVFTRQPELAEKQIELLTQTFPERRRLGVLWEARTADQFSAAERRARAWPRAYRRQARKRALRFRGSVPHFGRSLAASPASSLWSKLCIPHQDCRGPCAEISSAWDVHPPNVCRCGWVDVIWRRH